ncbi:MAG: hypothetical protein ACKO8Z_13365 [Prosthecobacter sp.]
MKHTFTLFAVLLPAALPSPAGAETPRKPNIIFILADDLGYSDARPLNALQPDLDSRLDLEQAACLHANMDLYKWSSKLWPWTGSDLIGECFELALAGRDLAMPPAPMTPARWAMSRSRSKPTKAAPNKSANSVKSPPGPACFDRSFSTSDGRCLSCHVS